MQLISVNIGTERIVPKEHGVERTGIYKLPVEGPVQVTALGLPGDAVCDKKHHGGLDQAVYVYGGADYEWWAGELGRALAPGTFGENLTIGGLESPAAGIGDRFTIGTVVLEVAAVRIPCKTLARRMSDPQFIERFRRAARPGLYCRVLREGSLRPGDAVTGEEYPGVRVGVMELFHEYYASEHDETTLRRLLAAPLAERARRDQERRLAAVLKKTADIHEEI